MKVLIDTNVWLDVTVEREPYCWLSKGALMACISDGVEMNIAATSLKDIFYVVARHAASAKAYEAIEMILSIASIAAVDSLVCKNALNLEQPDYEDGIIAAVALAEKVDCVITRDTEAFHTLGVAKYTPEEFVHAQGYVEAETN